MRSLVVAAAGCAVVLAIGGCSSSSGVPGSSTTDGGGGSSVHQFSATLSVTGATTKSESYVEPLETLPSCAVLAKNGLGTPPTWSVPQGQDQVFYINWNITPYTGPGTYTNPSVFQDSVDIYTSTGQYSPGSMSNATLSITVNADGSGSATFKDVPNFNQTDAPSISGTLKWTCS